jgi:uncharacterized membrane protein YccC
VVQGRRAAAPEAVLVAVVLAAALAAAGSIGVALGWTQPYWVPEPVLLLTLYVIMGKRERIREKTVGTAIGAAAALPVAVASPPQVLLSLIATAAFIAAVMTYKKSYALYYGLYTVALVLALSSPGQVGAEAAQRGSEILAGIAILVAGLAVVDVLGRRLAEQQPQPALAGEAGTPL